MKGAIVINGYLRGRSFEEPAEMMAAAAERHGVVLEKHYNDGLCIPVGDADGFRDALGDVDFIICWDKDVRLAKNLEVCGYPVFNCSECIRVCDDKSLTHMALAEWGIPSIKTIASPMTFGASFEGWAEKIKGEIAYPMVVKESFGSFGEQVRLVKNDDELFEACNMSGPHIFQPYIECGSEDIRVEVVGGAAVAAVKRTAPHGDFRSNASSGGKMTVYEATVDELELAVEAAEAVEADFCGVDIISSKDGPVVCEVNSNAHIKNLKDCTGIDVSDRIMEHILDVIR